MRVLLRGRVFETIDREYQSWKNDRGETMPPGVTHALVVLDSNADKVTVKFAPADLAHRAGFGPNAEFSALVEVQDRRNVRFIALEPPAK